MKRVVILASGGGTLAQAIFDARSTTLADVDIVAVISDQKDAHVIARAEAAQIESFVVPMMADRTQWDRELETLLGALKPDLVVSAGFMRLLSAKTVERFKIINSHPSLLPLFPGAHAVRDALQAGATQTGTTLPVSSWAYSPENGASCQIFVNTSGSAPDLAWQRGPAPHDLANVSRV